MKAFALVVGPKQPQPVEVTCIVAASNKDHCEVWDDYDEKSPLNRSASIAFHSALRFLRKKSPYLRPPRRWDLRFYIDLESGFQIEGKSAGLLFALLTAAKLYEFVTKDPLDFVFTSTGEITLRHSTSKVEMVDGLDCKLKATRNIKKVLKEQGGESSGRVRVFYPVDRGSAPHKASIEDNLEFTQVETVEGAIQALLGRRRIRKLALWHLVKYVKRAPIFAGILIVLLSITFFLNSNHEAQYGSINFVSDPPGATLSIDHKAAGPTPIKADSLEAGVFRFQIAKPCYEVWQKDVRIEAGADTLITVKLPPLTGTLILQSIPPANIFVDGEIKGKNISNEIELDVPHGRHVLRFQHSQYGSATFHISIACGVRKEYVCYYNSDINVVSSPGTAMIKINGEKTDLYTPHTIEKPPGTYQITVHRNGYETVEGVKTIEVRPALNRNEDKLAFTLRVAKSLVLP